VACITHHCTNCGWDEFNNYAGHIDCPKCGSEMGRSFDEQEVEEVEEVDDD